MSLADDVGVVGLAEVGRSEVDADHDRHRRCEQSLPGLRGADERRLRVRSLLELIGADEGDREAARGSPGVVRVYFVHGDGGSPARVGCRVGMNDDTLHASSGSLVGMDEHLRGEWPLDLRDRTRKARRPRRGRR